MLIINDCCSVLKLYSEVYIGHLNSKAMKSALLGGNSLALLADEGLVDVGDDSTSGNGGLDQGVQLLVS